MKKVNLSIEKKSYGVREAIRTLRTNLQFCGDDKRVILVTSCVPREGKSSVSVALAECGANIDDISQTILGDMFSMTMLTTLDTEKADFNAVQEKLEGVATELGVQITIQREDVFQFMYKI